MERTVRTGALALALVALSPGSGAQVVDCWLLDARALSQARAQGLCGDVFARNSGTEIAEARRNPMPPAPPPPEAPTAAFLRGLEREVQTFVTDFDHDLRAFGRMLRDGGSTEPTPHR